MAGTCPTPPALETIALTKRYGPLTALDELSIQVEPGEVYGFLGPNGAGKTTTIRLLLGLARPTAGQVRLFGLDGWSRAADAHHRVGFVPGEFATWAALRGSEVLDLLGALHGDYDRGVPRRAVRALRLRPHPPRPRSTPRATARRSA